VVVLLLLFLCSLFVRSDLTRQKEIGMAEFDMFDWDALLVNLDEMLAERPGTRRPSPVEWSA
jgi:hypothetical protein